ncbi:MAG: hypothetical protein PWR27_1321 [Petroclostridium sp.]|jgi:HD-GYP domain-containing protein (c-di-GMP phosphodiesterase class II)|uniref:HD-GYP domain-containing protein n=1 Tax=Petroclostridium xylanilyticum TaxID=1792311 RepID=UPI000B98815B|nr:HD-GYP domain-containing protein [Petroclostridium xylanilyticum]MBZ4646615.1 metal dependent phosphohydrolase [Clostridia bacterium]MDK2810612.1 hypothetical protein [Petroclostridium sp.]
MRKISLSNVQSGMKLARSIYTENGHILLGAGMELKQAYINRLKDCNISEIYIEDEISKDIDVRDVINERTRVEAKALIKNIMDECKTTSHFTSDRVKSMVNRIIDELLENKDILVNLSDLKTVDDYTFAHSVNVCVLSLITGIRLGLNQLRLRDLGVGALLHDIGKVVIPEEILKKPSQLTDDEFEKIKQHTVLGYQMVKDNPNISASSAYIVLGHHERFDGSGYPLKIKGENIHLFARIVAIADVYDALTSDRVYRKKIKVHEVIEYITALGAQQFDKTILQCFVRNIALYPVGTGVLLSDGAKGIIVDVNRELPTRPIVRIIYNNNGQKADAFTEIDLTKRLNIMIVDTCEI